MKISFLTQYYPPEFGAAQRRLSGLAKRFVERGHDVAVLTAMPSYPLGTVYPGYGGIVRREQLDGVKIIRTFIYPTQKADYLRRLTNYFSFVFSSSILGSAYLPKADFLLVESPPLFLGIAGMYLARVKGARLIFNVSDLWPESAVSLGILNKESLAYRMSRRLEELCYRQAWLVTGQAKSILADITQRFPDVPTHLLSNGVDTSLYNARERTPEVRTRLGGDGECVALYAGLHGLAQGLDQIVDAAKQVDVEGGCRFVLIGDGPQKKALQEKAAGLRLDKVKFLDPVPASAMPALVASADIVLVTLEVYIPGAVPSKLYEAMASGRPLVLMADGEAAEIVRTYNAGIVVKPGDIHGLAEAIRALRDHLQMRQTMGANGMKAAQQCFDSVNIADRFIDRLESGLRS